MEVTERPKLRRIGVVATLTGAFAALTTVVAPSGAFAEAGNPCENPTMGDFREIVHDPADGQDYYVVMWMKSLEPTFNVAGFDTDGNDSDGPSPKTFAVTQSREFTIQTTHKANAKLQLKFWKVQALDFGYEFTQQLTDKHTTSSTVTRTITMAPHTALRAYNGVDAINGVFDIATWLRSSDGRCWWRPQFTEYNVRRNIPTSHERWELQQLPTINPGGVVNPADGPTTSTPARPWPSSATGSPRPTRSSFARTATRGTSGPARPCGGKATGRSM